MNPPTSIRLAIIMGLLGANILPLHRVHLAAQPALITTSTSHDPVPRWLNTSGTWLIADGVTLTFANGLGATGTDGGVFAANGALYTLVIASDTTAPNTGTGRALFQNNTADKNGGAISIASSNAGTSLTLINVTFDSNRAITGYGGAIASNRASTLDAVVFTTNTAATNGGAFYNTAATTITSARFQGNAAGASGGALYNSGNTANITNTRFGDNIAATNAGALYNTGGTATLTNSTFVNNTAGASGGAIYNSGANGTVILTDAAFQGNAAATGGAIYANSGVVTITRATFDANKTTGASSSHGGAVFVNNNVTFTLTSGTLTANTAVNNGGALYATGANASVTLDDVAFERNEAASGGAIYANGGTFTITTASFAGNTAATNGGALYGTGAATSITFDDTAFTGNTAASGGAIYANSGAITLTNATFADNRSTGTSSSSGGAAIYVSNNSTLALTNATFTGNTATASGGAFYGTGANASATLGDVVFQGNTASTGGAIYANSGTFAITSATFTGNTATSGGGALYGTGANATTTLTDVTFTANTANTGGALHANAGTFTLANATFTDNRTTGTSSSHGGALYIYNNVTLTLTNGTFTGNTAATNGGAIYGTGANSTTTLENITLAANTSAAGGALYTGAGTFSITLAHFESNTADNPATTAHGGAIHNAGATLTLTTATLSNNIAKTNGGALYTTGASSSTELNDTAFRGNTATSGGAIYTNSGIVAATNATFAANRSTGTSSSNGGAAIYVSNNSTLALTNATFSGNTASTHGGAIYGTGANATLTLTDATFTNNTAGGNGGAIYTNRSLLTIRATTTATNTGNKASGATNATGGFLYITGTDATVNFDITGPATRYIIGDADATDRTLDTIASGGSGAAALGHTITKTGGGALILNADNSAYCGALVIDAGSLLLGNPEARLNATTATINSGALGGLGTLTGNFEFRATSTLFVGDNAPPASPAATPTLIIATTATTAVTLRDGASIGGSGTLLLTGPNNTLTLETGSIAATVAAGETLVIAAPFAGPGALEKRDAGTLHLSTANTFTGGITLAGGTLAIDNPAQLGAPTNEIRFAAHATLAIHENDLTLPNNITLTASVADAALDTQTRTLTLTGILTAPATATLTKTGPGTLHIDSAAGANTAAFAGTLRAAQGTLAITTPAIAGNIALAPGTRLETTARLSIGGTLSLDTATLSFALNPTAAPDGYLDSARIIAAALAATGANTIDLHGNARTGAYNLGNLAALAPNLTITIDGAGQLPDSRRKATLRTSGDLLIIDTQIDMSRALLWTGGSGPSANLWTSAPSGQWTDTGTVNRYAHGDRVTFQNASATISIQTPVTVSDIIVNTNAAVTTTFTGASITADPASLITGTLSAATGSLHKTGPGTLSLENAANTFHGGITLDEGTIAFTRAGQLNTAGQPITITGPATIRLTAATANNVSGEATGLTPGTVTLASPLVLATSATLTLDTPANTTLTLGAPGADSSLNPSAFQTFSPSAAVPGGITGAGALIKTGPGTLVLAAPAAHTGPTLVQTGTLRAAAANVLSRDSHLSLASAATLDLAGHDQTLAALTTRGATNLATARLTIAGDYTATRATLQLALNLSDTAAPQAGALAISGSATGRTAVSIQLTDTRVQAARAPLPSATPALITTAAPSPGDAFALANNTRLVVGAYEYLLLPDNAAAAREWRLIPDNFSPEIPAVAGTDAIALQSSRAALDTLLARLDDLRPAPSGNAEFPLGTTARSAAPIQNPESNIQNSYVIWADALHRRDTINQTVYTGASISTIGLQAGAGLHRRNNANASAISLGVFADISDAKMNRSRGTTTDASIRGTGLYGTYALRAWHVAAIVRGVKTNYDITAPTAATFTTAGTDFGATLQASRYLPATSGWRIEPIAALAYQRHTLDDATDSFGRAYKVDPFTSLAARLAVAIDRAITTPHGILIPRVRLSALHEFDGQSRVHIADDPTPVETNLSGLGAELDASLLWRLNARWTLTTAAATRAGAKFDGYSLRMGAGCGW